MKRIIKTASLLAIFAVIPCAFAATSRVSMVNKPASRLPSIAGYVVGTTTGTTVATGTTSSSAYYDNSECIEKYTECIKDDEVCGSDMSECTTNVLFHAQMPKCLSVLYQCQPSGINALFGTSAINALSTGVTTNSYGEITDYTYPTSGSVLGQLVAGAGIANKFSTEQCVKSYTRCLQRDDVCGADFELCTSQKEFKKQAVLCASTLARCQSDGKKELFGSVSNADTLSPAGESRLKTMIDEGAGLAAMNAVRTCQKVTDNCLINACTKNPLRCVEGVSMATIYTADIVSGGVDVSSTQNIGEVTVPGIDSNGQYVENYLTTQTGSDVRKMLKAQCLETIGTNKYCHMTYREKAPSNKELMDIDLQEDVFSLAYAARKDMVNTKIQEALKKFDTRAKDKCYETIKSCAMRSCGGGLGSVCYKLAGTGATDVHVNNNTTYGDIQSGCSAIVNADANCIYAATAASEDGYQYAYTDATTFQTVFPPYNDGNENDIIGAVGKLNALLATSYNDAAIESMKKQCQTVALSCVKSMCGKDYVNCYRNRTDIISGSYDTGNGRLDRSMNKMGGVLDYNIVMGLCMDTVKNSDVCDEHLKVATAEWRNSPDNDSWEIGTSSVRDAWLGANTTKINENSSMKDVVVACRASGPTEDCIDRTMEPQMDGRNGHCYGIIDEDGCIYDLEVLVSASEYVLENGAKTLFQTLLMDVEKEAQAKYNAKLTKEQNTCLANNNGGIMGHSENGSTFMWVKLKGNKVPKTYTMKGLKESEFSPSNDLYGSFCRVRVTIQSDDKYIQNELGGKSIAYFAVGDSFTCGSWIDDKTLQKISEQVSNRKVCEEGYGKWKADGTCDVNGVNAKKTRMWLLSTIVPAVVGGGAAAALTESGALSGILGLNKETKNNFDDNKKYCVSYAEKAIEPATTLENAEKSEDERTQALTSMVAYANTARSKCEATGSKDCGKAMSKSFKDFKNADKSIDDTAIKTFVVKFKSSVNDTKLACESAIKPTDKASELGTAARIAIPVGTALVSAGTGAAIVANVIKSKKENIKNEAAQEWMSEVGDHIQCYIGTEEAGSYGDVISFEIN